MVERAVRIDLIDPQALVFGPYSGSVKCRRALVLPAAPAEKTGIGGRFHVHEGAFDRVGERHEQAVATQQGLDAIRDSEAPGVGETEHANPRNGHQVGAD